MSAFRRYWDPEVETLDHGSLRRLQAERLQNQLDYVLARSSFYQRKFAACGLSRDSIKTPADLRRLPVTTKEDIRRNQEEVAPFGDFVAADLNDVVRLHTSSGTTGRPTCMLWTQRDLDLWADGYARLGWATGLRPNDVFMNGWSAEWFVGGQGSLIGFSRLGAMTIPASSRDSKRVVQALKEYGVTAMTGTPSFLLYLADVARSEGVDPASLKLKTLCLGGEPGANIPATRERLQGIWNARAVDVYGGLEFQPIAWECREGGRLHLQEDRVYAEVLHKDSLEPVPDGQPGVLVLTHLAREATPLVRWWTGDVVVPIREACPCGRTHLALMGGVIGRADDMLIIKGVNLFPSAVEHVLRSLPDAGDEFQIVVDQENYDPYTNGLKQLKLRVELKQGMASTPERAAAMASELRSQLGVGTAVELLESGTLPRTTMKAQRIVKMV